MSTFQPRFRDDTVASFLNQQNAALAAQKAKALAGLPSWMQTAFGPNAGLDSINQAAAQYGQNTMNRPRYGQRYGEPAPSLSNRGAPQQFEISQWQKNPAAYGGSPNRPINSSPMQAPRAQAPRALGVGNRLRATFQRRPYGSY